VILLPHFKELLKATDKRSWWCVGCTFLYNNVKTVRKLKAFSL